MHKKWLLMAVMLVSVSLALLPQISEANNPSPFNTSKAYFYNFYGVSPLPCGDVWVVGSHGIICKLDKTGKKWIVQKSGIDSNLFGVSFVDSKNGWAVGEGGLILHTNDGGSSWKRQYSHTTEHLSSVCFKDANNGWVVGAFGTILHTADGGKNWVSQGEKVDKIYNSVYFFDTDHGWIAGEFGTILHTSDGGHHWQQQTNPLGESTLFRVYFQDINKGWITGMDGTILHTVDAGKTWKQISTPVKEHLFGIQVCDGKLCAVGLKGECTMTGSETLVRASEKIPTRAWLKQVAFADRQRAWIVGSVGTVLFSCDGGATWQSGWNTNNPCLFNGK